MRLWTHRVTFFPPHRYAAALGVGEGYPEYKRFVELNFDPYEWGKLLYVLNRELRIDDYQHKARTDETGVTETLQSVFLTYKDEYFPGRGKTYKVRLPNTGKELAYTVWMREQSTELVYVIPGTGGHRLGNSALAVAEVINNDGRSAVTISSAMNSEFVQSGSTVGFPGFIPADAHDVHMALDGINKDLDKRFPGRFTKRDVVGLSLGASHVLFMAAESQSPQNELIKFDHYRALNAPVSSQRTAQQLDDFYNVPLRYPHGEQRDRMIHGVLRKVLDLTENQDLQPGEPLPFAEWEAEFLIGLSFRKDLVILSSKLKIVRISLRWQIRRRCCENLSPAVSRTNTRLCSTSMGSCFPITPRSGTTSATMRRESDGSSSSPTCIPLPPN